MILMQYISVTKGLLTGEKDGLRLAPVLCNASHKPPSSPDSLLSIKNSGGEPQGDRTGLEEEEGRGEGKQAQLSLPTPPQAPIPLLILTVFI
jgi:hypothetical protein